MRLIDAESIMRKIVNLLIESDNLYLAGKVAALIDCEPTANVKTAIRFSDNFTLLCPNCNSSKYIYSKGNIENEYCGQCGCHLDWENLENINTDEIVNRSDISKPKAKDFNTCADCVYFKVTRTGSGGAQYGICEKPTHAEKIHRVASQRACKKWTRRTFDLNEKINN